MSAPRAATIEDQKSLFQRATPRVAVSVTTCFIGGDALIHRCPSASGDAPGDR